MTKTQYRISAYGPGVMAQSRETGSYAQCLAQAPGIAVQLKEEEGLSWCAWHVEPATCPLDVDQLDDEDPNQRFNPNAF